MNDSEFEKILEAAKHLDSGYDECSAMVTMYDLRQIYMKQSPKDIHDSIEFDEYCQACLGCFEPLIASKHPDYRIKLVKMAETEGILKMIDFLAYLECKPAEAITVEVSRDSLIPVDYSGKTYLGYHTIR